MNVSPDKFILSGKEVDIFFLSVQVEKVITFLIVSEININCKSKLTRTRFVFVARVIRMMHEISAK